MTRFDACLFGHSRSKGVLGRVRNGLMERAKNYGRIPYLYCDHHDTTDRFVSLLQSRGGGLVVFCLTKSFITDGDCEILRAAVVLSKDVHIMLFCMDGCSGEEEDRCHDMQNSLFNVFPRDNNRIAVSHLKHWRIADVVWEKWQSTSRIFGRCEREQFVDLVAAAFSDATLYPHARFIFQLGSTGTSDPLLMAKDLGRVTHEKLRQVLVYGGQSGSTTWVDSYEKAVTDHERYCLKTEDLEWLVRCSKVPDAANAPRTGLYTIVCRGSADARPCFLRGCQHLCLDISGSGIWSIYEDGLLRKLASKMPPSGLRFVGAIGDKLMCVEENDATSFSILESGVDFRYDIRHEDDQQWTNARACVDGNEIEVIQLIENNDPKAQFTILGPLMETTHGVTTDVINIRSYLPHASPVHFETNEVKITWIENILVDYLFQEAKEVRVNVSGIESVGDLVRLYSGFGGRVILKMITSTALTFSMSVSMEAKFRARLREVLGQSEPWDPDPDPRPNRPRSPNVAESRTYFTSERRLVGLPPSEATRFVRQRQSIDPVEMARIIRH